MIKKKEGKNNYNYFFYDCADRIIIIIFFMIVISITRSFDTYQSGIMFLLEEVYS